MREGLRNLKSKVKKGLAARFIKPALRLHSLAYEWSGKLAVIAGNGSHPKHAIIRYQNWFVENIEPGWVILDVGCHWGMMAAAMAAKAEFVYGIELEPAHVKAAEKRFPGSNLKFICADATRHDFSGCRPIDCVTLSNVLEHVDGRVEFLRKLVRNVNWSEPARKRFLIRVPMIDREWIAVYKRDLGLDYRLDRTHFIEYTSGQLEQELHAGGLRILTRTVVFGETYAVCEAID